MTTNEANPILEKTMELCQVLLDQEDIQTMRRDIDIFLADDKARQQYELVVEKHEAMQQKQQSDQSPTPQEVEEFETHRRVLMDNPVARSYFDAQREFQQVQQSIVKYVTKTFELGRVPAPDDFSSCGHGCSCGH